MLQEGDMEVLLVIYHVTEEPKGFSLLGNYTVHACCISKSSAILIVHLTFQPQQKGKKLLIKHNMHITTPESDKELQKCC